MSLSLQTRTSECYEEINFLYQAPRTMTSLPLDSFMHRLILRKAPREDGCLKAKVKVSLVVDNARNTGSAKCYGAQRQSVASAKQSYNDRFSPETSRKAPEPRRDLLDVSDHLRKDSRWEESIQSPTSTASSETLQTPVRPAISPFTTTRKRVLPS